MFGKKKNNETNQYDAEMLKLRSELAEIGSEMTKKVKDVYIKSQAVTLYLDGTSDWERACADRYEAQQSLHCSIEAYDNKRAEILRYAVVNCYNFEQHWNDTLDSHTWIENTLKHFLKK